MIHYLTDDEAVKRVFWLPEMIERIAAMLNYLMGELAGPNMSSLKVRSTMVIVMAIAVRCRTSKCTALTECVRVHVCVCTYVTAIVCGE